MNQSATKSRPHGLLLPPLYAAVERFPRQPTAREIWTDWIDAIAFWRNSARALPALYAAYHLATFGVFVMFFARHLSVGWVASVVGLACFIATVYNTVWYHRYCSHQAFAFRSLWWARLFLWTNPVCFREESYVLPHRVHHSKSDEPGDPYGPHLGWLGSYLATESQQRMNLAISAAEYGRLALSLAHIGFPRSTYSQFQRTGSVERLWHYLARFLFVNLLWPGLGYWIAGPTGACAWIAAIFLYTFVVRDFNFRGHGGLLGTRQKGSPLNQAVYGIIAGEWHENHHAYPRLARSGLAWWQVDLPFVIICLLYRCGVIRQYHASIPAGRTPQLELELTPNPTP